MASIVVTVLAFALIMRSVVASSILEVVSTVPYGHVPIAINNNSLTSFSCTVHGGVATWEIAGHQFSDKHLYQEEGIIIDTSEDQTSSNVSFSREGLDFLNRTNLSIRCYVFDTALFQTEFGEYSYIVRYGAPDTPHNLQVTLTPSLHLSWQRPSNLPPEAPVSYSVNIMNMNTMDVVQESTTTQLNMDVVVASNRTRCEPHSITVVAWNDAGNSSTASIRESIPIVSPNVISTSRTLAASIDLNNGSGISITLSFQSAQGCRESYPVLNHTVIVEELANVLLPLTDEDFESSSSFFTATLTSPDLAYNVAYTVHVTACSSITCRQSESVEVRTVDVQSATVIFTHTNVYLSCAFTSGSAALGCQFAFTLAGSTHPQTFNVSRTDKEACVESYNQRDAYTFIEVFAIDRDGQIVSEALAPNITENDSLSGCPSTDSHTDSHVDNQMGNNAGAIAGGMVAGVVAVAAVVGAVAAVAVFGYGWYKAKKRNERNGAKEYDETDGPTLLVDGVHISLRSGMVSTSTKVQQKGIVEVAQIKITAKNKMAELAFVESSGIKLKGRPLNDVIPLYTTSN